MKKILVGVPYHPAKAYCRPLFMASVHEIGKATKTAKVEIVVRFDPNPKYGDKDNVKNQREWFRKLALDAGFDALYFHGHDTIPPANVIDRLLGQDKDVISGVYWLRPKSQDGELGAVAWWNDIDPYEKDERLKDTSSLLHEPDGFGLDCVLISRDILKAVSWMDWEGGADDYEWCDRVKDLGTTLFVDSGVQCRHYENKETYSYIGKSHVDVASG